MLECLALADIAILLWYIWKAPNLSKQYKSWPEFSTLDVGILVYAIQLYSLQKRPNLKLKTWPQQLFRWSQISFCTIWIEQCRLKKREIVHKIIFISISNNIKRLHTLGNFDIDFFVFHYRFLIMSLKFLNFKIVWISALKLQTVWKRKHNIAP
jgi:hypothetical protein